MVVVMDALHFVIFVSIRTAALIQLSALFVFLFAKVCFIHGKLLFGEFHIISSVGICHG